MNTPTLYIAGMGMVSPLGPNVAMTAAAVTAGMSAYEESRYFTPNNHSIVTSEVPHDFFSESDLEMEMCGGYNEQFDNIIKMSIMSILEVCEGYTASQPTPLVLALADPRQQNDALPPSLLVENLVKHAQPWVSSDITRCILDGRAAGIIAIDFVFKYLMPYDYVLVVGSDSHNHYSRLNPLAEMGRLLTFASNDSFSPGEAGCSLLLTSKPELALKKNGKIIALYEPGVSTESGHFFSDKIYMGDGLDTAFKKALINQPLNSINTIYSSMNGENHWAKEYGVASMRNREYLKDNWSFEHPADCLGDLGSATSTANMALSAEALFNGPVPSSHLVYCSSDTEQRAAIVLQSISVA